MIAFDLDGVFISDLSHSSDEELERVLEIRHQNMRAIFRVPFPYYLITGRPKIDEVETLRWLNLAFAHGERPSKIFHDNQDYADPAGYKISVLRNNPDISTFIESDAEQAATITRSVPTCRVVHFETWLTTAMEGLVHEAANVR